jgi:hypothetical protein
LGGVHPFDNNDFLWDMAMDGAAKDIIIVGKLLVRWIIDGI